MVLEKNELLEISGGGFNIGLATIIIGGLVFIIGVIDGLVRPYKCR